MILNILKIFRRMKYKGNIESLSTKCEICKLIHAGKVREGKLESVVLSEVPDGEVLLTITPVVNQFGRVIKESYLCSKHNRMLFKYINKLVDSSIMEK